MRRPSIGRRIAVLFAATVVSLLTIDTAIACRFFNGHRGGYRSQQYVVSSWTSSDCCAPVTSEPNCCGPVVVDECCGGNTWSADMDAVEVPADPQPNSTSMPQTDEPPAPTVMEPTPAEMEESLPGDVPDGVLDALPDDNLDLLDETGDNQFDAGDFVPNDDVLPAEVTAPADDVLPAEAEVAPADDLPGFDEAPPVDDGLDFGDAPAIDDAPAFDEPATDADTLPGFDDAAQPAADVLPGFDDPAAVDAGDDALPGFDDAPADDVGDALPGFDEAPAADESLPGFDDVPADDALPGFDDAPVDDVPADDATPADEGSEDDGFDDLFGFRVIEPSPTKTQPVATPVQELPMRTWTDNTGRYQTVGRLVKIGDTQIRMLKENGRFSTVTKTRLSQTDLEYVRQMQEQLGVDAFDKVARR